MNDSNRYILLPKKGFIEMNNDEEGLGKLRHIGYSDAQYNSHLACFGERHPITVVDSVCHAGPKLILMAREKADQFKGKELPENYRLIEEKYYKTCTSEVVPSQMDAELQNEQFERIKIKITVINAKTNDPVVNANVIAYFDPKNKKGSATVTDSEGVAQLIWSKVLPVIPQLIVIPDKKSPDNWGSNQTNVAIAETLVIPVTPVEENYKDCVKSFYPSPVFDQKKGILVGVVDTGVDNHKGLNLIGGENTVTGESPNEYHSNGDPHGTFVAGLVGASGVINGTAPGVSLKSYRVFGKNEENATNFAIIKAIFAGAQNQCDVINLSMGVNEKDDALEEVISHARSIGTLVIAAPNNNYGGVVGYPSAYKNCIAVSAMGRIGTVPDGTYPETEFSDIEGGDSLNRLATFTSVGPEINYIAPGVGVISTISENGFGQLSGTSMACPVVTGCMASLLAQSDLIMQAPRDLKRVEAMSDLLKKSSTSLGFSIDHQGYGLPADN